MALKLASGAVDIRMVVLWFLRRSVQDSGPESAEGCRETVYLARDTLVSWETYHLAEGSDGL